MAREEFKQRVFEQQIFNELKDGSISINYIKSKYQGLDIDYSRIYKRIINYQIETYGCSISNSYNSFFKSKEEYKKASNYLNKRKHQKLEGTKRNERLNVKF